MEVYRKNEEYKRKISDLEDVVRQKSNRIEELENKLKEMDIRSMSTSKDIPVHEMGVPQEINARSEHYMTSAPEAEAVTSQGIISTDGVETSKLVKENGKDSEFKELLQLVNALDLLELFNDEKVGKNELMACDLNDLRSLGISFERAQQLHGDLTKETKRRNDETDRKRGLLEALKHFHCEELYDDLIKIGYTSQSLNYNDSFDRLRYFSIDHDALKKIGLSFAERKKVLTNIQERKERDEKEHEKLKREMDLPY